MIAFGRHISPGGARALGGEDLRFTFERKKQGDGKVPYWKQGNASFDKTLPAAKRAALRDDPHIIAELERFWSVYAKRADGSVDKAEYLAAHARFGRVLIPDIDDGDAAEAAEEDWLVDAEGCSLAISRAQLFGCLFELADLSRPARVEPAFSSLAACESRVRVSLQVHDRHRRRGVRRVAAQAVPPRDRPVHP